MSDRTLIIGCGSGRCGTVSLQKLLDRQARTVVSHERFGHELDWKGRKDLADLLITQFRGHHAHRMGDVHGAWTWYADHLIKTEPRTKIVCFRRPQEETVASILAKTEGRNKFQPGKGASSPWDGCAPTYDPEWPKRKAVQTYWTDLYARAEELAERFPDRFRIFDMEETLNTRRGQLRLFTYLGIPNANLQVGIKENAREAAST